ncbi:oxidoreductase domain-containing protein, partial [mine drainage metagenome]
MSAAWELSELRQCHPLPSAPRPIVIIGAGGIVNDAHLPAYRKAGFDVLGLFDVDAAKARATAEHWGIERVYVSLEQAAAVEGCVFDVAAPPVAQRSILATLAPGAVVLVQKPLGLDLAQATAIRAVCRQRRLTAAVNFQLRFAPMMYAAADALARGLRRSAARSRGAS